MNFLKKWAINHYILSKSKPQKLSKMRFVGIDSKGKRYYSWEKMDDIPKNRVNEIQKVNTYIDNKISPPILQNLLAGMDEVVHNIIKAKDNKERIPKYAQLTQLINEIRFRDRYCVPTETLCALASILTVREDEDPNEFSEIIHEEKSTIFEAEQSKGNYFFLSTPIFKTLMPSIVMSEESWKNHSAKSIQERLLQNERLGIILHKKESSTSNKEKMN